jgi:hypothetical protein
VRKVKTTGTQELEGIVTAGTEVVAPERGRPEPGKVRVPADIPAEAAHRLKVWASIRRTVPAHLVAELVCQALPDWEQLGELTRAGGNGGRDDV